MSLCKYCGQNNYIIEASHTDTCNTCIKETEQDSWDLGIYYMSKGHTPQCAESMAFCKSCSCGADESYLFT